VRKGRSKAKVARLAKEVLSFSLPPMLDRGVAVGKTLLIAITPTTTAPPRDRWFL